MLRLTPLMVPNGRYNLSYPKLDGAIMGWLILFIIVVAVLYVLWDRGTFGKRTDGAGPAQSLGQIIDRGVAKTGRAVEQAGRKLEAAADGDSPAVATTAPTPLP